MAESRAALVLALALLLLTGCVWRRAMWDATVSVRFVPDLSAAWHWGERAIVEGYWNLYDAVIRENPRGEFLLDYVPLRLAVCEFWVHVAGGSNRLPAAWPPDWPTARSLLLVHTTMELAAAAAAFLLVRHWLLAATPAAVAAASARVAIPWRAAAAAAAIWLNPALMINSHGRPGTDVWILPFYLGAVLCGVGDRWLCAGLLVGTGAMFKGQQFIVAPLFLLWPLFQRRLDRAGAWLAGAALGVALWSSPWSLSLAGEAGRHWSAVALAWVGVVAAGALAFWRRAPRPARGAAAALAVALAIFFCIPLFGGDAPWFQVGARYGAAKYSQNLCVDGAFCLAGILQEAGWTAASPVLSLPGGLVLLTMRHALFLLYALLLVLASALVARLHTRRDPRLLVAIALPWLVWFSFAAQIHERYLLFGAAIAGIAVAVDAGVFLLAILLSAASLWMTLANMLGAVGPKDGPLLRVAGALYPDLGWVVILATLLVGYRGIRPVARGQPYP